VRQRASAHGVQPAGGDGRGGWRAWATGPWGKATAVVVGLLVLVSAYVAWTLRDMPDPGKQDVLAHTIIVYDRKGREIEQRNPAGQYHVVLPLSDMGKYGPAATLAAEDRGFYHHGAIDYAATGRALMQDLITHGYSQGGSTITQQLVKIQLLTPQKSIFRKIQEAVLAEGVETRYSKDQILDMYLNRVYYGHNAYGIGAAAKIYFDKNANDLTPAQAAFLAGLIQAPVAYDPQTHFDAARARQLYALRGMVSMGTLTAAEEQQAEQENIQAELKYSSVARQSRAPHFVDYVIGKLEQTYGNAAIQQGGFAVHTTLDLDLEAAAQDAVTRGVRDLSYSGVNNADLLAVNPSTGEILAWVGSADYFNNDIGGQYDVILSGRSPGSSFKAYTYEAAFKDRRYMPGSTVNDTAQTFGNYKPNDFDNGYLGRMTIRKALLLSRNIPAVEVANKEGIDNIINLAHASGVTHTNLQPVLSTAIGGSEVTMFDHVQGYATFANQGTKVPLFSIAKVVDSQGNVLIQNQPGQQEGRTQVMTPAEAYLLTDILKRYPDQWHFGWRYRSFAAKTGTSGANGVSKDSWIMAYNSAIVAGAWVGNTGADGRNGNVTTYGELVADSLMRYFIAGLPPEYDRAINRPDGLVDVRGCDGTPDIALPEASRLSCSGLQSPSPSPSPSPTALPTLPLPPSPSPSPSLPSLPPTRTTPSPSPS
jgi:membrane peptidoglycan carboxypeptidase